VFDLKNLWWVVDNANKVTKLLTETESVKTGVEGTVASEGVNLVKPKSKVGPALLGLALLGAGLGGGFAIGKASNKSSTGTSNAKLGLASEHMAETFRAQLTGDYETYWSYLYPSQQEKIDKAVFLKCVEQPPLAEQLEVRSLDEFDQEVDLGVPDRKAKVVTVQFRAKSAQGTSTRVVYTLLSKGRWRWLLGQDELAAYSSGTCTK
jgi:hypothetical protein